MNTPTSVQLDPALPGYLAARRAAAAMSDGGAAQAQSGAVTLRLELARIESPLGPLLVVHDAQGALRALDFADYEARLRRLLQSHYGRVPLDAGAAPAAVREALGRYFAGELQALQGIAWKTGGTTFQRAVWQALTQIPPGQTRSYGELARSLGLADAARAVGWANGSNPVALVVPCHRVIGADGSLTGYAGGLHRKAWLLGHEGARAAANLTADLFGH
jgi:methylated-DNA-[protein]-cysteine S-methyltransferase